MSPVIETNCSIGIYVHGCPCASTHIAPFLMDCAPWLSFSMFNETSMGLTHLTRLGIDEQCHFVCTPVHNHIVYVYTSHPYGCKTGLYVLPTIMLET